MLISNVVLTEIMEGRVDTLFRRQKRRTVKEGGTLGTQAGLLDILEITEVSYADITPDDARRAGFDTVDAVIAFLEQKPAATDYRVRVRPRADDPRVDLRSQTELSADELDAVCIKLERMDGRSPIGPWTQLTLHLIADRPRTRAAELAESVGRETLPFKTDVRKLKNLGLTLSHEIGYELSPRGRVVLEHLDARA